MELAEADLAEIALAVLPAEVMEHADDGAVDPCRVVVEKGPLSLRGWSPTLDHVLGNAGLTNLDGEPTQFAKSARCAPEWIG